MTRQRRMGPNRSNPHQSVSPPTTSSHFFKIMLPSTIQDKKLMIPPKFARKIGDELSAVATLSVANGRVWQVGLTKEKNNIFFHDGWQEFVEYYSIRYGYFLVFSYKGISKFHVLIFDMTACEIKYPFNGPSSEEEADHDKQYPVLNEDEMEDDDSIEILGFKNALEKRVFNRSSRKQAMNKRYNPSSKQDCLRTMVSTKNVDGNWTRSKKCKTEDQVEIEDLDNVKDLSQFNEGEHTKNVAEVGSANKNTKPREHELLAKSEDDMEIIVTERFSSLYTTQERERAIHAAKLFKPKNPSFMVLLRPSNFHDLSVYVPLAFAKKYLSRDSKYLTLQNSDGKIWYVRIKWKDVGGPFLRTGFYEFSRANNLEERDVCVFELIKRNEVVLKVSILHVSRSKL